MRFFLWSIVLLLTGCELVGFVSEARAREIAVSRCNSFHLEQVQAPTQIHAEWMTADAAKQRGLENGAVDSNSMVWLVTLEGTWRISGGPKPPENATPAPPPIFHRCIIVLDAKTGDVLQIHAQP